MHPLPSCRTFALCVLLAALASLAPAALAATYTISTAAGFSSLPATLQAGDVVLVKDGTYANVGRTITAAGTSENPVLFQAEHPGGAVFSGGTQFSIKGSWLIISGFVFDGDVAAGGPKYSSGIFRFNADSSDCTLRDCRFNNYDTGVGSDGAYWIQINGYRHTIEYCSFSHKSSPDPIINIIPPEDDGAPSGTYPTKDIPRRHRIRYCYFGPRTEIADNGYETIRIGESRYQMYDLSTVVEYCLFEKSIYGADVTGYEPEVISSKSRNNIYRYNTLLHCKGGIVLRHGDDCVVEGNFIFGEPGSEMGSGIRVIGQRHIVRNNYLQDIDGTGLRAAICLMKGSGEWADTSTSNGYESPSYAKIFHNTIVACAEPFALGATTSSSGTTAPRFVELRGNVVLSAADDGAVVDFNSANSWTIDKITFAENFAYHPAGTYGTLPATGLTTGTPLQFAFDAGLGYFIPQAGSPALGAAGLTSPVTQRDLRGALRPASGADAGAYDTRATAPLLNRPLVQADVGPVYDGRAVTSYVATFLTRPQSLTATQNTPVALSVTVGSDDPVTYQWCKDDAPLAGATAATLSFASVQPADAGAYTVHVTNAAGISISDVATLTVLAATPVITAAPASQTANLGDTVTFTVEVSGAAPFGYTWTHDGTPIPGATEATLTLDHVQSSDAGAYAVTVSNAAGSVTSAEATLTLAAAGEIFVVNDSFADGNRSGDTPPSSLAWFCSSGGSNLTITGGAMTLATATGGRHAVAHFPLQTLAVGDRITLRFTFSLAAPIFDQANGLRFGLFNRNSNAAYTADSSNPSVTYTGYAAFANLAPTAPKPASLRRRNASAAALITTSSSYTTVGSTGGPQQIFAAGTTYTAALSIQRTAADGVELTSTFTGGDLDGYTLSATDTDIIDAFDTVAIAIASNNSIGAAASIAVSNVLVVRDTPAIPPGIAAGPSATTVPAGAPVTFTINASGTAPLSYQWFKGDAPIAGATAATLDFASVTLADAGSYTVTVTNSAGSITSVPAQLVVTIAPSVEPSVTHVTAQTGELVILSTTVAGTPPPALQWFKDGVAIPGATDDTYTIVSADATSAGTYTVVATNSAGTVTSTDIIVTVQQSYLSNLSVRATLTTTDTLIVGFVVSGAPKPVLVRAAGPALVEFNLPALAGDPRLALFDADGHDAGGNDNWDSALASTFTTLGALPFANGSTDAAVLVTVGGPHTAHATTTSGGTAVVEVYDADVAHPSRLVNLSARYRVGTGDDLLIAGFVIGGTGTRQVLVRAIGPSLAGLGVSGWLPNPQVVVYDHEGNVLAQNDDWDASLAPLFDQLGAFDLPAGSHDAALVLTLPAGAPYTVHVSGVDHTTGEALVEVYDVR